METFCPRELHFRQNHMGTPLTHLSTILSYHLYFLVCHRFYGVFSEIIYHSNAMMSDNFLILNKI
ncbi:MAG: hypothetical protein BGO67_01600 [Alphaproteobacteria bacterium 41-28]|nr:MAG: hypothetical protein BGO67_01600 [Alphaproteobacteria bacterium 41-28]